MTTATKKGTEAEQLAEAATLAGIDPNDLNALLDIEPQPWLPEEGDKLTGWVVGKQVAQSEYGDYPLVFVLTEDGRVVAFHAFHAVARAAVSGAQQGDRIGAKYLGRKPSKIAGHNDYANYNVIVQQRFAPANALGGGGSPALGSGE